MSSNRILTLAYVQSLEKGMEVCGAKEHGILEQSLRNSAFLSPFFSCSALELTLALFPSL